MGEKIKREMELDFFLAKFGFAEKNEWLNSTRWFRSRTSNQALYYQVRTIFWHNHWSGALPHVSNRMKRSNLQKTDKTRSCFGMWKHTLFWGGGGRKNFFSLSPSYVRSLKNRENLFVLQFCSWDGSFQHGEMKIWLCLYFQHVTRYSGTDLVEESRQNMQRSEKEHSFREGCRDREENISKTANKRCSRQVLQLPCSWWYSIKFDT